MKIASFFLIFVFYRTLAENNLYTVSDGGETKICLKCPPGFYVFKNCIQSEKKSTECGPCPSGRYTDTWNGWHACKACRPHCYEVNLIIITGCQPDQNIVCGCNDGFWHQNAGTASAKCLPLYICGLGFGVDKPATNISDVTCIKCVEGTNFSSVASSYETCQPCRGCQEEGYNQTNKCTVISNAECFIRTTSSSTTTEGTTPGDDSNEGEKGHSNVGIIVGSILGIILVIVIVILACFVYRCRRRKRTPDIGSVRTISNNNVYVDRQPTTTMTTASNQMSSGNLGPRRRYSNLCLKEGIVLENDVFTWISTRMGDEFERICKLLPGEERITNAKIDNARYNSGGLPDVIAKVLTTWRNENIREGKNENEFFHELYITLYDDEGDMRGLAVNLKDKFAL